ncbi:GNAT family N-acetyltransferase [Conchiformibius kuhniae]|uniref:GNAT family N-acetyltransferase n=1 Tax=Conchiformibius kuhniae TaxID=211502 RepID=A0A8T9MWP0_9NEIS|nr:GNAT family N-acetyltransferase [Conchiformibius kuhniae]UOP04313.1 GNAT family N-acetyltransferase [Conchiformibius kuhniae]
MLVCNPEEIIIHGTTGKGKVFRPSDWAERLCGILSSFNKDNRLSYHEWVRPVLLDKIRCVAIAPKLEEINPGMFRFLMDFANDNNLRVLTYAQLLAEAGIESAHTEPTPLNEAVACVAPVLTEAEKAAETDDSVAAVLREIGAHETSAAFAALSVLRPKLKDINGFVEQINKVQRAQGYRLLGIFEEGRSNAVAVCGFREETNLVSGKHIHIDDLVTVPQYRKHGYGTRLLQEVQRIARANGVAQIHIDSNVGGERTTAHRIYFQHGFEISAYHFVCELDNLK